MPNLPAGHESAALLPRGQYAPCSQTSHAVLPSVLCIVPAAHGTQASKRVALATLPAVHGMGSVAPVLHEWPGQHSSHCSSLCTPERLVQRPEGHGSGAAAPSAQYDPGTQAMQLLAPMPPWYWPASHGVQAVKPVVFATLPAVHGVGLVAPVLHECPGQHSSHCSALCTPERLVQRLDGQGSGAVAPSAQYDPGTQLTHSVAPLLPWYLPASHLSQLPCLVLF